MKSERKRERYRSNIYYVKSNENNKVIRNTLESTIRIRLYINIYDIKFNSKRIYNN